MPRPHPSPSRVLVAGALLACALAHGQPAPAAATTPPASASAAPDAAGTVRAFYNEALVHGRAYADLTALVSNYPGRLSGSQNLENAIGWAQETLAAVKPDQLSTQPVMVPHWERGEPETVFLLDGGGMASLSACALGGSGPTPSGGVFADVIEVHSIDELNQLGRAHVQGKIVFFNRPMDPTIIRPMTAYGRAVDQRIQGPAAAAQLGAAAALVRSMTERPDDVPHTGVTIYPAGVPKIPAAALSIKAADRLSAAVAEAKQSGSVMRVGLKIHSRWLPDAPSHNVIAEIRGAEFPGQIILVGAHLDSWDIAPGAHDDGAGVVQSIEVLRLFRALGLKPRHTIRCVLFVDEETSGAGAKAYAASARTSGEQHILALETDAGGFAPRAFSLATPAAVEHAARWLPLLRPYDIAEFRLGGGGSDVTPLGRDGVLVGELAPDSQRYFDVHHSRNDTLDNVNPRELELGAASLASLIWLVDTQGI